MPDRSFLGTGMKFPPQVNKATGRFVTASLEESVKESVYLILMTQKTERFLRPQFGSTIMSYTFMDVNATNITIMKREVQEAILQQEPRVSDVDVTTDGEVRDGCLLFTVSYTVAETHTRDNLVFPFYLNAVPEEEEYEPEQYEEPTEEV